MQFCVFALHFCLAYARDTAITNFVHPLEHLIDLADLPSKCNDTSAALRWKCKPKLLLSQSNFRIQVQYRVYANIRNASVWMSGVADLPASARNASVALLHPNTFNEFRVVAHTNAPKVVVAVSNMAYCYVSVMTVPARNPRHINARSRGISNSTLNVSWDCLHVTEQHGPTFRYVLTWKVIGMPDATGGETTVNGACHYCIGNLPAENNLVVSVNVHAANAAGDAPGPPASQVLLSGEAVPSHQPQNLRVLRMNSTMATLAWRPIAEIDFNGLPKGLSPAIILSIIFNNNNCTQGTESGCWSATHASSLSPPSRTTRTISTLCRCTWAK
jgi:hypothetical protein